MEQGLGVKERQEQLKGTFLEGEGERLFLATFNEGEDNKQKAQKMAEVYGGVVKDFGVDIHNINPESSQIISWNKVPGYSV
ncbi:hypothetical protein A3B85_01075 [Candidatus Nomurabacteria bacterium RIFCSPHIGHO2_02_FULL_37_13]|uniref:Uncharacterized protein n=1 Tax=Candidatus Nomurabacteria bacterium RIFCSPHIGHO2_02_FULL_37_13 TaxID=1801750 RepID=A0A1F6W3Z0_9BACT|nr:MAG: hypothetical protein A2640_00195 [Candidatus Nomurabacteria bacterium RIFCSPHIGHO2_01_FULL_36_23]OGI76643.1 MAG: hypothetical protein A3B85_01075 [Candidatus Nomurabacteria bacterium RIFCSPHIGHO2_02_FULL_37_13]OGI87494.1 MAG: hypothetical protein A2906_00880 [Candidatus Nomurabacteria bacterium RIFCSPLOWO2_01_FULL_37_25]